MSFLPPIIRTGSLVEEAEAVILSTYGDTVSVARKGKDLAKHGRNLVVGTAFETVAEFQGTESNETFVSTNLVDSISSSNAGDTQSITVEGHTIDGSGNLTFAIQTVALTGQTKKALTTPLARATRAYVAPSGVFNTTPAALAGTVYVYDDTGGITAGVPNTASATKVLIAAGDTKSQKGATTISSQDYWLITNFSAGIGDSGGSASLVTVRMETRDVKNGGVWIPLQREIVLTVGQNGVQRIQEPYLIVPKNHDFRIRAKTDANTAEVFAQASGPLALVVS